MGRDAPGAAMPDALDCALDLMRRLPPEAVSENLEKLVALAPDLEDDLRSRIDAPLKVACDESPAGKGRSYLCCDYNRDGDSYRSPWSNQYFPAIAADQEPPTLPSADLRAKEIEANEVWSAYRQLYYEGGLSSVYLWEADGGFAGCFLIKKRGGKRVDANDGSWDAVHVVEVDETGADGLSTYTLTSTAMLYLRTKDGSGGEFSLAGHITRQAKKRASATRPDESHLTNIGKAIEEMEGKLRNSLDQVYFGKTQEVVGLLRTAGASTNDVGPVSIKHASSQAFTMQTGLIAEMMAKRRAKSGE